MNKAKLKNYAPLARRQFIQAVTDRSHYYGLSENKQEPVKVDGDFAIITGRAFPKAVAEQRTKLEERIAASSFDQVMEEIAYTWFNRFVAMRYMELHGYLSHGYRVLSNPEPDNNNPEILEKAQFVELPGLDKNKVLELKMAGNKDEELYRLLLIAQCNELHRAMPFLFESIKDCTELLLPDNLLHSDSLIRELVNEIEEKDWQEVEIIGWMYQFYISEKKDQVIGSVVKSEDIPAATQLFTPNWIVKYLVQNSLGAQWMRTYPDSALKSKMEYYIEPAQQSEEVQKQLKEITPDSLNPEELTLLDPACGSGHILVEGYDLLKEIYLERGYRKRDIPELILKKNLFGLEIDDRAAQLAGFAVVMKARCDERQIFERQIQPNIVSIQETKELDLREIVRAINAPLTEKEVDQSPASLEELQTAIETPLFVPQDRKKEILLDEQEKLTVDDLKALLGLFEYGKTFGSLIRIPETLAKKLPAIANRVNKAHKSGILNAQSNAHIVLPFINQAMIMAGKYDAVVANPPYMGNGAMNSLLKNYAKKDFPDTRFDLFAMFIERGFEFARPMSGHSAMVTMQSWMFLSSFENMRESLLNNKTIYNMAHLGPRAFSTISGEVVTVTAFSFLNNYLGKFKPSFLRLINGNEEDKINGLRNKENLFNVTIQEDFKKIPCSPIAYWASKRVISIFENGKNLNGYYKPKSGMSSTNNDLFLRLWHEVHIDKFKTNSSSILDAKESRKKWFPYSKGGEYRKWKGNKVFILNYYNDGEEIKYAVVNNPKDPDTTHWSRRIFNTEYFFKCGITWSRICTSKVSFRITENGSIFSDAGPAVFVNDKDLLYFIAILNAKTTELFLSFLNPTLTFQVGDISNVPIIANGNAKINEITSSLSRLLM